jgi:uncharacterized protein YndB with AHSA1/START domain
MIPDPDPELDLVLERTVDVRPALVWAAWTQPELLMQWFTPKPWTTVDCKIDLRPGGRFDTVMRSPEGQEFPGAGCYLEVVPEQRLAWTNALIAGFRPAPAGATCGDEDASFQFTAVLTFESSGDGTRYRAHVMHADPEGRAQHEAMGFHDGWGAALDQLVTLMRAR